MKISKEASRKIPAALGLFLILELCFGNSAAKVAELFSGKAQESGKIEVVHGR